MSNEKTPEGACPPTDCSAWVVLLNWAYEGDELNAVFLDEKSARARADQIYSGRNGNQSVRVERWEIGAQEGELIYLPNK